MDESIKRVEKLVHATNSALAQMKFSLMFDDMTEEGKHGTNTLKSEDFNRKFLDKFLEKDCLKECQDEFQSEANEVLANVEKMFSSSETNRKNSKALDRIKELNNKKKQIIKLEQSKPEEIEQSRQKLLSLIREEKFSPGVNSIKESVRRKSIAPFDREKESCDKAHPAARNIDSLSTTSKTPVNSKVELKQKLLETQEIVDRGFLAARQLAQKVECMTKCDRKEKTPSTDKTASDNNFRSLGSRTESNEAVETLKCKRRSGKKKGREKAIHEVKRVNAQVIDVKRNELQRRVRPNLQLQRLPSVHIKGGLKLQTIHNLEIPASEETTARKSNTAISFLSHEGVEREKMNKVLEKVRRENCIEENIRRNYVECFNCGKMIRIREAWADPRKIDKILYECNFNVFDPRIDEFVEKFGAVGSENFCESTGLEKPAAESVIVVSGKSETKSKNCSEKEANNRTEEPKKSRGSTLQEFSNKLFKKYRQEVESLEDKHVKFDNLLQNVLREVNESRGVFDDCNFFKNPKSNSKRISNLSATTPVLVTLRGSSFKNKKKQNKFHKEHFKKTNKNRTDSSDIEIEEEKKLCSALFSSKTHAENANPREGVLSFFYFTQNENVKPNSKEFQRRFCASLIDQSGKSKNLDGKEEMFEKSLPTPFTTSRSSDKSEAAAKHKPNGMTRVVTTVPKETRKPPNGVLNKEEMLSESVGSLSLGKDETIESSQMREGKAEEEKTASASSSGSSNSISRICFEGFRKNEADELKTLVSTSVRSRTVKALLTREDVERESLVTSPKNKINNDIDEKAEIFERSSLEKSENNYESDFESFSNELDEKDNFCKDEEPRVITYFKKLSTISEVDSEMEKKISEGPKISKSMNCEVKDTQCKVPEAIKSDIALEVPFKKSKGKKTSKASFKNVPLELVTSLKDILSELQDQCVRTESLANKLTENVKIERKESDPNLTSLRNLVLSPWEMPAPPKMVENLQSARKNWTSTSKPSLTLLIPESNTVRNIEKSEKDLFVDSLSDEGGSSLGEIIVSERRKRNSGNSGGSSVSERSYLNLDDAKQSSWPSSAQEKQNTLPD